MAYYKCSARPDGHIKPTYFWPTAKLNNTKKKTKNKKSNELPNPAERAMVNHDLVRFIRFCSICDVCVGLRL